MIKVCIERQIRFVEKPDLSFMEYRRTLVLPQGMDGKELIEYKLKYKEMLFLKLRKDKIKKIKNGYEKKK